MTLNSRMMDLLGRIEEPIVNRFSGRLPRELYEPMAYLLEAGGKRIRPLLLALSCKSTGGSIDSCLDAAVAVELLHTFTLVHDDIMDRDVLRRGRPTVHVRWDEATAILAGDGLVTAAYDSLIRTSHPNAAAVIRRFTDSLTGLCEGQALDKLFESRPAVTPGEYLDMIEKKTGRLIEASCGIGALLGSGTDEETACLERFGAGLGRAFQIQDDLLDVAADVGQLGKPLCSDIVAGKKTFLTVHFASNADEGMKKKLESFKGRTVWTDRDTTEVRNLFASAGSFDAARRAVAESTDRALEAMDRIRPSRSREDLRELALSLVERAS
ncbi:polyprenyl synthetase family protein [bacterium]|nr:polyprenyl synthetase family protein [bacterium]